MFRALNNIVYQFIYGLIESLSIHKSLVFFVGSKTIQVRFFQCFLLNGVLFIGSLLLYTFVLTPVIQYLLSIDILALTNQSATTTPPSLSTDSTTSSLSQLLVLLVYRICWLYPIYAISFILSTIWYQDIANHSFALTSTQHPHRPTRQPKFTFESWLTAMAEELYRQLISFTFFVQTECIAVLQVPIIKLVTSLLHRNNTPHHTIITTEHALTHTFTVLYCIHLSWYYALYAYDYKWSMSKTALLHRLTHFQTYWSYYAGFGFPSALLTLVFPKFFNAGIFALSFPVFLILAIVAKPIDQHYVGRETEAQSVPQLPLFAASQAINYKLLRLANYKRAA